MSSSPLTDSTLFPDYQTVYTIKTESFEGPFDLLLHLIKKNEVDIYNIPIAAITRQYLEYLDVMKELNLDIAGDFLVMASTLIQIKSRMLLPLPVDDESPDEDGEDPRAELVRRLLEYSKYKEAAVSLGQREILERDVFIRKSAGLELEEFKQEGETIEVELFEMIEAFHRILATVPAESFHDVGAEGLSIADRINELLLLLQGLDSANFEELFIGSASREQVIVTFLAILELCRLKMVRLTQARSFGTILVVPALLDAGEDKVTEEDLDRDFA
ncbi:MAG TPA: segregation/condensation protein A [Geobacteraceae bacterium]|nr:segregation/condensation protein A [Geobacteraceae bacterium]